MGIRTFLNPINISIYAFLSFVIFFEVQIFLLLFLYNKALKSSLFKFKITFFKLYTHIHI